MSQGAKAGQKTGTGPEEQELTVELSVFIEARPETVFSILSDPERLSEWMNTRASFELREGSPVELRFDQFGTTVSGELLEVVPNRKLSLTWGVSEGEQAATLPPGSTRVTFTLAPEGDGTRVELRHSGFPTEEEAARHEAGWRFHLSRLSVLANRAFLAAAMEALGQAFFGAWNASDDERRRELLESCVAEEVRYRDEYAAFEGRELLSRHIGNTRGYLPGQSLEPDGEARICRGEVLIPWRLVDDEGDVKHRGVNHARVTPDGRIRELTGFWTG